MTIKRAISQALNSVLGPVGLELRRKPRRRAASNETQAPKSAVITTDAAARRSFMVAPDSSLVVEELANLAEKAFSAVLAPEQRSAKSEIAACIREFIVLYQDRPLQVNTHGGGFNNCLWVYLTARLLKPSLVIESGAMRGQSSWVLRTAAPDAQQHCFDIDLSRLVYRSDQIRYHEHDWVGFDFGNVDPAASLIFFDDHVSHQKRILEAKERGFRYLVLDDNLPIYQLCKEGDAQVAPTLDMIFDPTLTEDTPIRCVCLDKTVETLYSPRNAAPARAAVAAWENFPQAHLDRFNMKNRLGGPSKVALCRLASTERA